VTASAAPEQVVAGIDIGGTSIKGLLSGRDGAPRARWYRATPVDAGVTAVVDAIAETATRLCAAAEDAAPVGVGLVLPGVVDRAAGMARYSANIGWRDLPIRDLVSERVGLPVAIEHDVRGAALAELTGGAARGRRDVLYVSIGTGLAGALITDGAVVHGSAGLAGEIGHVPVVPGGEVCACGQRGCAEAYASAASVSRRYARITGDTPATAEVVFARAADGDEAAQAVLAEAVVALSRTILGAVLLADPEVVVLGGGMSAAGTALTGPVSDELSRSLRWRRPPPVVVSPFGSDAGARGAALLAWSAAGDSPTAPSSPRSARPPESSGDA
jgi:glucokinase